MFSSPKRQTPEAEAATVSVFAPGLDLTGLLRAEGVVRLDGRLFGTAEIMGTLVVGPNGVVSGDVYADRVTVVGRVEGDISATQFVSVAATASVAGNIRAPKLEVMEGALIGGRLAIGEGTKPAKIAEPLARLSGTSSVSGLAVA